MSIFRVWLLLERLHNALYETACTVAGQAAIWSGVRPGSSGQSLIGVRQLRSGSSAAVKSASMKQQHSSTIQLAMWVGQFLAATHLYTVHEYIDGDMRPIILQIQI